MSTRTVVIANPKAGRGAMGEGWQALLQRFREAGLEPEGRLTEHAGHAVQLARDARTRGAEIVVAAGGDGTVHEVVNGLLADGVEGEVPALGIVPTGSGCDYVKTFGIPTDPAEAVAIVASGHTRLVDVAELACRTEEGEPRRYFVNIAEVGFGPEVVDRASRLPRSLRGSVYFFGFWLRLPRFERPHASIDMDEASYEGRVMNVVIALGRVFGGGMRVAPNADPSDGLFDVQVHHGSKVDYVRAIPKVYKGTHIPHPRVREERAARVDVRCEPPALIEADGEVVGRTPATFRVVPSVLRLRAPDR